MKLLSKIKLGATVLIMGSSCLAAADPEDTKNPDNFLPIPQTVESLESAQATNTAEDEDYTHATDQAALALVEAKLELNTYLKSFGEFSIDAYSALVDKLNKAHPDLIKARFKYIAFHQSKRVYSITEALDLINSIENNTVKDVLNQAEQAIEQINTTGRVEEIIVKPRNCSQQ